MSKRVSKRDFPQNWLFDRDIANKAAIFGEEIHTYDKNLLFFSERRLFPEGDTPFTLLNLTDPA